MDVDVEGIILPNKSLNNIDLDEAVKQLNIPNFRGVFCRNELPKAILREEAAQANE